MGIYLYGASIQGIQSFIFESNELKEIAGASELVEQISTEGFKKFLDDSLIGNSNKDIEIIIAAAGNIKLVAKEEGYLHELVRNFPKYVNEKAPGLTISQALVQTIGEPGKKDFACLEKKLQSQRNISVRPAVITALGIERSRKTGKPAIGREYNKLIDKSSKLKALKAIPSHGKDQQEETAHSSLCKKLTENLNVSNYQFPSKLDLITSQKTSMWLAVIHADGNELGKVIQTLNTDQGAVYNYKAFSQKLGEATISAAKEAFLAVVAPNTEGKYYPFRPIVLGGDDLTVICRADLALEFTQNFLSNFETNTRQFNGTPITACAGIAFVKEKYPFHYAVKLAEELCSYAKKVSKEKKKIFGDPEISIPASIMFHKIQSSFTDSFKDIRNRELYAHTAKVDFCCGPYAIHEKNLDIPYIGDLVSLVDDTFSQDKFPVSGLRRWLSELHKDQAAADKLMNRIIQITGNNDWRVILEKHKKQAEREGRSMIYDALSLNSLKSGGGK
jgi:hypothetical protein